MNITNWSVNDPNDRNRQILEVTFERIREYWRRIFLRLPYCITIVGSEDFKLINPQLHSVFDLDRKIIAGLRKEKGQHQIFCFDAFEAPIPGADGLEIYILQLNFLKAIAASIIIRHGWIEKWLEANHLNYISRSLDDVYVKFFTHTFAVYFLDEGWLHDNYGEDWRLMKALNIEANRISGQRSSK